MSRATMNLLKSRMSAAEGGGPSLDLDFIMQALCAIQVAKHVW